MDGTEKEATHEEKDASYYQYYALTAHQAQMLQDVVRTSTYQKAILSNAEQCFRGEQSELLGGYNNSLSLNLYVQTKSY
jgi:hypothetical protein